MTPLDPSDLSVVNNVCNSMSIHLCIESQEHPDPKRRRAIDFAAIDAAVAAAERMVKTLGPDTLVPGSRGNTAKGLLIHVQGVAALAAPYRTKARRA